jgi:signal transduction histidine kinase
MLTALAEEQAALRRVATLVASMPAPDRVFHAVAEEAGRLLDARTAVSVRFGEQGGVVVGCWDEEDAAGLELGTFVPYSDPEVPVYRASQQGGRVGDYTDIPGEAARMTREAGYRSSVVAPIVAGGRTWGALFVFSTQPHHFGPDAERRLAGFTELVGLALESVEAYDQLRASRTRIVEAGLGERRRLERNLHDGAQQRLVSLSLQLRLAQRALRDDPHRAEELLAGAGDELSLALEELRELARGLHPAVLTDRGLEAALASLADRAPFPVEIAGASAERFDEAVEAALYYVVAESLTNAAKYADASHARVEMSTADDVIAVAVHDDGRGGAKLGAGSGLRGLADRVEALGGRLDVRSPVGAGTVVRAQLPLRHDCAHETAHAAAEIKQGWAVSDARFERGRRGRRNA